MDTAVKSDRLIAHPMGGGATVGDLVQWRAQKPPRNNIAAQRSAREKVEWACRILADAACESSKPAILAVIFDANLAKALSPVAIAADLSAPEPAVREEVLRLLAPLTDTSVVQ